MCVLLAMGLFASPAFAAETETGGETVAAEQEAVKLYGDVDCELHDGIFTIRIKALDTDDKNFWWQFDRENASKVQVLTETDMEEGLAYAGSFRGIEDGEDTIRMVHTNGFYVDGYLDFIVNVKDGKITEEVGGGEGYGVTGEELAPALEGLWEEKDGPLCMEISVSDDNALDFVISDGSGTDGTTVYYTMTAYYDCIKEALVYQNGMEIAADITDGSETEAESQAEMAGETEANLPAGETEAETDSEEGRKGCGSFILSSEDGENVSIVWQDDTFGHTDTGAFLKAE